MVKRSKHGSGSYFWDGAHTADPSVRARRQEHEEKLKKVKEALEEVVKSHKNPELIRKIVQDSLGLHGEKKSFAQIAEETSLKESDIEALFDKAMVKIRERWIKTIHKFG